MFFSYASRKINMSEPNPNNNAEQENTNNTNNMVEKKTSKHNHLKPLKLIWDGFVPVIDHQIVYSTLSDRNIIVMSEINNNTNCNSNNSSNDDSGLMWYCSPPSRPLSSSTSLESSSAIPYDTCLLRKDDGYWYITTTTTTTKAPTHMRRLTETATMTTTSIGTESANMNPNTNKYETLSLILYPPSKKDYWKKTYYQPILKKDDAPFLYHTIPLSARALLTTDYMIEASFTLVSHHQFDQGGIMIRYGSDHWLKTGVEVVDKQPKLSCVVTNIYSDWSTQPFNDYRVIHVPKNINDNKGNNDDHIFDDEDDIEVNDGDDPNIITVSKIHCALRVHIRDHGTSFVVEAKHSRNNAWELLRIAHLHPNMKSIPDPLEFGDKIIPEVQEVVADEDQTQQHKDVVEQQTINSNNSIDYDAMSSTSTTPAKETINGEGNEEDKEGKEEKDKEVEQHQLMVGLYGACPVLQEGYCSITFHEFKIYEGSTFVHTADE